MPSPLKYELAPCQRANLARGNCFNFTAGMLVFFCACTEFQTNVDTHISIGTLHHRNTSVSKLEWREPMDTPETMPCNGATKSISQLLTCRCTSRGRSRHRSNPCRVSSTETQSDICCFEGADQSQDCPCASPPGTRPDSRRCVSTAAPRRIKCAEGR